MEMVSILLQQQLTTTTRSNNVKKRMSLTDSTQISSINEHKVAMKADALNIVLNIVLNIFRELFLLIMSYL